MPSPLPLIGRTAVLADLRQSLAAAVGGHGRVVLLTGDAGIGKTAAAAHLADEAARDGLPVAWGRCSEGTPAFWPWTEVLRETGGLTPGEDHLGAPAEVVSIGPEQDSPRRFQLFDRVTTHLAAVAKGRGFVIVLDDLHWADDDSLALLQFMTRQLAGRRILIIGTYRDVEGTDRLRPVAAGAEVRVLGALDVVDVGELMANLSDKPVSADAATAMHLRTGGNPLFVRELTRLLNARANETDPWHQGATIASVRDVIERRFARLSQPCVRLLRLAALDGNAVRPWLLRLVMDDEVDADVLLDEAIAARVLVVGGSPELRFAHDLFREVLIADLPAPSRRRGHRDLAEALLEAAGEGALVHPAELAAHFRQAAAAGDDDTRASAVRYARAAAIDATSRLAFEDAVSHLQDALAILGEGPQDAAARQDLLLAAADAQRRAGRLAEAATAYRHLIAHAHATGNAHVEARAALGLHATGVKTGPSPERHEHVTILTAAGESLGDDDPQLASQLRAALARTLHHTLDATLMDRATVVAEDAVTLARQSGDPHTLATALLARHDVSWRPGTARRRLEILDDLTDVASAAALNDLLPTAALLRATALLELGDPASLDVLDQCCAGAERRGDPMSRWLASSRRASGALLRGHLEDAALLIDRADQQRGTLGDADTAWVTELQRWELARFAGGRADFRRRDPHGEPPVESWAPWRAVMLVEAGDAEGAAAVLAPFTVDRAWGPGVTSGYDLWFPAIAADAAARVGTDGLRADLYDLLLPYTGTQVVCGASVAYSGAVDHYLALLATALDRDADDLLSGAISQYQRLGARPWTELARRSPQAVERANATAPPNRFSQDGTLWTAVFGGLEVHLADRKGLHDLSVLLSRPGQPVAAHELAGVAPPSAGTPALDRQAVASYRRRVDDLDDDIAQAESNNDLERAAIARIEREAILDELRGAVGLGGRTRRLGDDAERARKTVTARILRALQGIDSVHPALGAHLRSSIRTGATCSYEPPEPTKWRV